ncbi:MAG TPA: RpiB/LacA/LacB family sugar-phosphate isomerase, partial [Candidatus Polarisedimenticolia bacterium]|nr:RpiB/LacA/LacB family sugar-phosphate isomerase [Candidatus Polarisedimenticolia bacterium]
MKLALASDHAGWDLKNIVAAWLRKEGHDVMEVFPDRYDPQDDYPDAAAAVGRAVSEERAERGVLICGSGVGACVAANKIKGVRAGLCHDTYSAHQGVEHDDVNVLCLGARVIGDATAIELLSAFLGARFSGEERHARRLAKVKALE